MQARHAGVYVSIAVGIGYVSYRTSGSILRALGAAMIASLVIAPALIRLDQRATTRLKERGLTDGTYPVRIALGASVRAHPTLAIEKSIEALKTLPNFKSITISEPGREVFARTKMFRDSWGEKISIQACQVDGGTRLYIKSVPRLWTVTEDMRMNYQNVALILKYLQSHLVVYEITSYKAL